MSRRHKEPIKLSAAMVLTKFSRDIVVLRLAGDFILLFSASPIYIVELLSSLERTGIDCYIGNTYTLLWWSESAESQCQWFTKIFHIYDVLWNEYFVTILWQVMGVSHTLRRIGLKTQTSFTHFKKQVFEGKHRWNIKKHKLFSMSDYNNITYTKPIHIYFVQCHYCL